MHHIYHTEGIILSSRNFGEDGKYFFVFTKDFGLVCGFTKGIRKLSSRLRFVLQDYSYVKLDLVRGRDVWRITSASKTNILDGIKSKKENFRVFANISKLLMRLLAGEEPNRGLFDDFLQGLLALEKADDRNTIRNLEALMVLRALDNLGYIGESHSTKGLTKSPFEEKLVYETAQNRARILSEINKALKETKL